MSYSTIETFADLHQNFADMVGEDSPPASSDSEYKRRSRWLSRGREDLAKRFFWKNLLKTIVVTITANSTNPIVLPGDFQRPQALRQFKTVIGGIDYTDQYEVNKNMALMSRDFTTGLFQLTLSPTPAVDDTANLTYYAMPAPFVNPTDLVLIDGDSICFYALIQYHFKNGNYTDLDNARAEYENRVDDLIKTDVISIVGSSTSMLGYEKARHVTTQRNFYQGTTRRSF